MRLGSGDIYWILIIYMCTMKHLSGELILAVRDESEDRVADIMQDILDIR